MKFLFYIASLVCVSSVPISSVPERHIKQMNQSFIGLRNPWVDTYKNNYLHGYMVVAQDKYCNAVHRISDSALNKPSPHSVANHQECKDKCSANGDCRYYLWTDDGDKLTCATFKACGITTAFQDGHGGFIYKKLVTQQSDPDSSNPNYVTPTYTLSTFLMPSTTLPQQDEDTLSLNPCDPGDGTPIVCTGCTLAMPRTSAERDVINTLVTGSTPVGGAWGGTYLWLGGHWDYTKGAWYWNDGTQILDLDWDNGEPGHLTGSQGEQDFLGMKRSGGKWHDFHGNDQPGRADGKEKTEGQQGVCEQPLQATYALEANDKYCCGNDCNEVVILDTGCNPDEGCNLVADAPTALWGSKANCERSCTNDPDCSFYLWREDTDAQYVKSCATFKSCGTQTAYNDGNGGCVYKKE